MPSIAQVSATSEPTGCHLDCEVSVEYMEQGSSPSSGAGASGLGQPTLQQHAGKSHVGVGGCSASN